MTEQEIEAKIASALNALAVTGLAVNGLWTSAAAGTLKGEEDAATAATATVAVPVRMYERPTSTEASFDGSIELSVRADEDPRGVTFAAAAAAIANLLAKWNESMTQVVTTFTEDDFNPTFFTFSGGTSPACDRTANTWTVTFTFSIRGIIASVLTNEQEA